MYQKSRTLEITNFSDISLEGVDLVLIDLDNTLYSYDICHNTALKKLAQAVVEKLNIDKNLVLEAYHNARKIIHQRHSGQAASHSRLLYIQLLTETLIGRTDAQWVLSLHELYWQIYFSQMKLFDGALSFLQRCKDCNLPVVMVTDLVADIQLKKIMHLKIDAYFSFIVTSEEAAIEKPHPSIFELALNKSKSIVSNVHHVIMIGDNPDKDLYVSESYQVTNYLFTI